MWAGGWCPPFWFWVVPAEKQKSFICYFCERENANNGFNQKLKPVRNSSLKNDQRIWITPSRGKRNRTVEPLLWSGKALFLSHKKMLCSFPIFSLKMVWLTFWEKRLLPVVGLQSGLSFYRKVYSEFAIHQQKLSGISLTKHSSWPNKQSLKSTLIGGVFLAILLARLTGWVYNNNGKFFFILSEPKKLGKRMLTGGNFCEFLQGGNKPESNHWTSDILLAPSRLIILHAKSHGNHNSRGETLDISSLVRGVGCNRLPYYPQTRLPCCTRKTTVSISYRKVKFRVWNPPLYIIARQKLPGFSPAYMFKGYFFKAPWAEVPGGTVAVL